MFRAKSAGKGSHVFFDRRIRGELNLGRRLGLSVIAEGVENLPTVELLMKMGCTEAQGYYFGRPMPVGQFEDTYFRPVAPRDAEPTALTASAA